MTYIFRDMVPMCLGCVPAYRLYWYFECEGDDVIFIGHWDPRDSLEAPGWLEEVHAGEELYDSWSYSSPDTTWGVCYDVSKTPRENAEAEDAALWLSGSLIAPDSLYSILARHLALIRNEYGQEVPQLNRISFSPYLFSDELVIGLMPEAMERYEAGTYDDLDSLNGVFGLKGMRHMFNRWFILTFEGRYHPLRLAEVYEQVPSVLSAEPSSIMIINVPSTVIPRRRE